MLVARKEVSKAVLCDQQQSLREGSAGLDFKRLISHE